MNRRQWLMGAVALSGAVLLPGCAGRHRTSYLSAMTDAEGQHHIAGFSGDGSRVFTVSVPVRCHGACSHPSWGGRALVFARRPGTQAFEVNTVTGEVHLAFEAETDRHLFGHGCAANGGRWLVTTESHYPSGRGEVVVRDSVSYEVLHRYASGGIGPHECRILSDDMTLVVANGGILTHPERRREKLNLETMRPNLTMMDLSDGELLSQDELANHQLSIRHMDVSDQDEVVVGLQYEGPKTDDVPLVLIKRPGQPAQLLEAPIGVQRQMRHYTASVCIDNLQRLAAISCPKGGLVSYWSLDSGVLSHTLNIRDCAGVAPSEEGFVLTNGLGEIARVNALQPQRSIRQQKHPGTRWDNHLLNLS